MIADAASEAAAAADALAAALDTTLSHDEQSDEIPAEFLDALTCDVMEDPVLLPRFECVFASICHMPRLMFAFQWKHRVPPHAAEAHHQVCSATARSRVNMIKFPSASSTCFLRAVNQPCRSRTDPFTREPLKMAQVAFNLVSRAHASLRRLFCVTPVAELFFLHNCEIW